MSYRKARLWGIFGIILILFLITFTAFPLMPNDTLGTTRIIARQRTIEQLIVKDVLILAYRNTADHAQAVSELQNALPAWEQVERGLQNGDASLGISHNLPPEIHLLLLQAQSDFTSIDTAAHQILAHPSNVDQTQLMIILQHEHAYSITMFQMSDLFEGHIQVISKVYFGFGVAISLGLMAIWVKLFKEILRLKKKDEDHQ